MRMFRVLTVAAIAALAAIPATAEGVKIGKRSIFRNLVPAAAVEQRFTAGNGEPEGGSGGGVHVSTERPLSANRPCGRFWMKAMISTRIRILVGTAPM